MSSSKMQDYLLITDPESVKAIRQVRQDRKDFIKAFSGKVQKFGLESGAFEEEYGTGLLMQKRFVGGFVEAAKYDNDPEFRKKFKLVKRHSGHHGKVIVNVRQMNREFYREWEREVLSENPVIHHMGNIHPIVFSKFSKDEDGRVRNCPIASIFWEVEGGVLMRLAWFGRNEEDWIIDSKHKFVKQSEALRVRGL